VIKAVLIRNFISEVATVALNNESLNIPYTLGMTVLHTGGYLQEQANMERDNPAKIFSPVHAQIPATYFQSSCHCTRTRGQARKRRFGSKNKRVSSISGRFTDPFPAALNLQQQGEFIVGYYHQQQSRYTKKGG
jgi:CRISPR-associated protein Csd1